MLLSNFIVISYLIKILFNVESRENKNPSVLFWEAEVCPSLLFTAAQTAANNLHAYLISAALVETFDQLSLLSISRSITNVFFNVTGSSIS